MLFRGLARADVADGRRHQNAFGAFQRTQHDLDGKLAPVLPLPGEFDPRPHLLRQSIGRTAGSVGDQPLREAVRNDVLYLLAQEFIAPVAELPLGLHIHQDDLPNLVHHHHRIRSRFQQAAIPRVRFPAFGQVAPHFVPSP